MATENSKKDLAQIDEDVKVLHKMGYAQELARSMHGFSNFAISFSIICILAGGITSFQLGYSAGGGFSIGVGWLVGSAFALIVGLSMAQIASAYPTAGGLYHWSSILGGRGWGWATAWVNLLGLVFVIASVNVGVYLLSRDLIFAGILGINVESWGLTEQIGAVALISISQAMFNHFGIRVTTKLTDFSGYLILAVAITLTISMLSSVQSFDFGRLFTFTNNSGDAGGGVFPAMSTGLMVFLVGLLLPIYTITGFDASAHTSEETIDARRNVPKGIMNAIIVSAVFGYVMTCSFVLAMPDPVAAAADGGSVFFKLMDGLPLPGFLKDILFVGIVLANYLCALAGMTSTSRMVFAFARDGGLPASATLKIVNPSYRTPVAAIWTTAVLAFAATLYSPAFAALAAGCAVFLYVSYAMPIAAGLFAEGKSWTEYGPFRLGGLSKPLAVLSVLGTIVLLYAGTREPFDIVVNYAIGLIVLMVLVWFGLERRRFQGPPIGDMIAKRQSSLAAAERAVGERSHGG